MIYQFIYLDYGAKNILTKLKYSIVNLRHSLDREQSDDKIHLWIARTVGRNPAYDALSLERNGFIDLVEWVPFHNQIGEIRIQPGWYSYALAAYINQVNEPAVYMDANISVLRPLQFDQDAFYVWHADSIWYGLPWGFQTKSDAGLFLETFYDKGILAKDPATAFTEYRMWNTNMLHIPIRFKEEIRQNFMPMLDWIIEYYSSAYANLYVACSCAGQIVASFLMQDIAEREGVPIFTGQEAFGYPNTLRFISETEADISGSLRILFDG